MFNGRRRANSEIELRRENKTLGLKLLRANSELRLRQLYIDKLEILLRERSINSAP